MKKHILIIAALTVGFAATAQVNVQEMYDFNRKHLTTTLELFHADKWGSTFYFTDIYHPSSEDTPTGYYTEISRSLNFWQQSALAPLSLHVEWNGGQFANNAWLVGVEWFLHSSDFSNTLTLQLLYKGITGQTDNVPLQFTAVWGMSNLLGVKGLSFSGYLDIWGQRTTWHGDDLPAEGEETGLVVLCEPQLWYAVGQHFGCENLHIGGEVEMAYNFEGGWKPFSLLYGNANRGFTVAPCLGLKWVF